MAADCLEFEKQLPRKIRLRPTPRHLAMYYNFVRIHKTLRTTPAMAAKVTERLWEIGDIVDVLEAWAWEASRGTGRGIAFDQDETKDQPRQ
jgi:hypothetical protein